MMNAFEIRTDLAVEVNEEVTRNEGSLKGVVVKKNLDKDTDILVTEIKITNKDGEKALGREKGCYITIEADCISFGDEEYQEKAADILTVKIKELLGNMTKSKNLKLLIVGLGNREVTSDSLGPLVADHLNIIQNPSGNRFIISALSPGVLAQTGMETAFIIKGIVKETSPDVVIAIDALAARNSNRLNATIQLSNRGIHPGSGVGNHRMGLTQESLGVPVMAIGVPTVIDAPTIVSDAMENLINAVSSSERLMYMSDLFDGFTRAEKYQLIKEVMPSDMADMYVTPKNIDANVNNIASVLAKSLNDLNS